MEEFWEMFGIKNHPTLYRITQHASIEVKHFIKKRY